MIDEPESNVTSKLLLFTTIDAIEAVEPLTVIEASPTLITALVVSETSLYAPNTATGSMRPTKNVIIFFIFLSSKPNYYLIAIQYQVAEAGVMPPVVVALKTLTVMTSAAVEDAPVKTRPSSN